MQILQELESLIHEFNTANDTDYHIDTIRAEFSKQHKLEALKKVGQWEKLPANSPLLPKLKKRLLENEITSAHRLKGENIYYYNTNTDRPKYRRAVLVIFGIHQYHKDPPPHHLIETLLQIIKATTGIDVCFDLPCKPNLDAIATCFMLTPYFTPKGGRTGTVYINDTGSPWIDKIVFYNKAIKNKLDRTLWRIEATITITNMDGLYLALDDFKQITDMAQERR